MSENGAKRRRQTERETQTDGERHAAADEGDVDKSTAEKVGRRRKKEKKRKNTNQTRNECVYVCV